MAHSSILSRQVLEQLNRPTGEAVCLPNAAYTAAEILEAESRHVFHEGWSFVGVGADVPEPGDARPVTVAGLAIVLVRNRAGRINAFHNVCSHRGAELVWQPVRRRSTLVCPYHAWTYSLDGELKKTPHFNGAGDHTTPGIDRARMGLKPIRLEMWGDLIFVNVSGTALALTRHLAPIIERWSGYDLALLRHGGSAEFAVKANWKLAMENFLESYHLPWAHPTLNAASRMQDHYCMVEQQYLGQGSRRYTGAAGSEGRLPRFPGLPPEAATRAEYPTVLPNLMLGIHPDHFFVFGVDPVAPDLTHETFHFYFVGDAALADDLADERQRVIEFWRKTNLEDVSVVEAMQRGRRSPAYRDGRFSAYHERTTHEFQRRLANQLAASLDG
jgi:choline monooxygenase